ncbi:MAG: GNAT family N-acetyltransferase [Thermomicrobiales bacterium]|nr:GNAT family N-acetyltransferase [Thermomicrobiales bacterium]
MAEIEIRAAHTREADELTAIAIRSKAHWGYADELLELWTDDLTVDPAQCDDQSIWLVTVDGVIAGFGEIECHGETARLDDLWIDPPFMKMGLGRMLLEHLLGVADSHGCTRAEFEAEPHAVGFYEHMGARIVGEYVSTSVPGRVLPIMRIEIPSTTISTDGI